MANRFWVGGTGTWDAADTTHWATSSGAGGGASVPGTSDVAIFDASSGGGTVTVNTTVAVQQITMGTFTGTLDFSANDNNVTLSVAFSGTGTGTRTLNMGDGLWTLSAASGTLWGMATTTNLTFNANNSTIVYTNHPAAGSTMTFEGGGLTYHNVTFGSVGSGMGGLVVIGANTFGTLTIGAPIAVRFTSSVTQTISTALIVNGTKNAPTYLHSSSTSIAATISKATGSVALTGIAARFLTFTGGATFTATDSYDLGMNSGITITRPVSAQMIGG